MRISLLISHTSVDIPPIAIGVFLILMCTVVLYSCLVVEKRANERWEELKSADKEDPANED